MKNEELRAEDSPIATKSYAFANRIIKAYKYLTEQQREFTLSKQMFRSDTSIGAMVREAHFAQSMADFINKMSVALKEASEVQYWLSLLYDNDYIDQGMYQSMDKDVEEIISLLVSIVKTSKQNRALNS